MYMYMIVCFNVIMLGYMCYMVICGILVDN